MGAACPVTYYGRMDDYRDDERSAQAGGVGRYALFAAVPLFGHLQPLLRQAEELARRGWRVGVASTEEARRHVEGRPGVDFVSLGAGVAAHHVEQLVASLTAEPSFVKSTVAMAAALCRDWWPVMYDGLLPALRRDRPDVVVADYATFGALDAAETAAVPCVVNNPLPLTFLPAGLFPPAGDAPHLLQSRSVHAPGRGGRLLRPLRRFVAARGMSLTAGRLVNEARRSRGLPPVNVHRRLRDRLVLVNTAFGLEYSRPLPPLVQLVGPMLPAEEEGLPAEYDAWLAQGPPVAYVNLGTLAAPSRELLHRLAAGLRGPGFRALWVVRPALRPSLPSELAPNIRVESWVPSQLGVLRHPNVRAFVSHCGANGVHESLHAGTPLVGLPLFADHRDFALRAQDAGVGLCLEKHRFTPDELHQAVLRVSREEAFANSIPAIQSSFALAGGVHRAADLIEHAVAVGTAHYLPRREVATAVAPSRRAAPAAAWGGGHREYTPAV